MVGVLLRELVRKRVYWSFVKVANFDGDLLCDKQLTEESSAPVLNFSENHQRTELRTSKTGLMTHLHQFLQEQTLDNCIIIHNEDELPQEAVEMLPCHPNLHHYETLSSEGKGSVLIDITKGSEALGSHGS